MQRLASPDPSQLERCRAISLPHGRNKLLGFISNRDRFRETVEYCQGSGPRCEKPVLLIVVRLPPLPILQPLQFVTRTGRLGTSTAADASQVHADGAPGAASRITLPE